MMKRSTLSTINLLLLCFVTVHSFRAVIVVAPPPSSSNRIGSSLLHSTTVDAADILVATTTETTNNNNLLTRDRYIATNRFTVRRGREAKFEKRWALRNSRLATLDGFKYFHLMRRVVVDDVANTGKLYPTTNVSIFGSISPCCVDDSYSLFQGVDPMGDTDPFGNYVSFTIWSEKKHFNAWRGGEAFKEAHGGTSLFAFVSTMVGSAMVLKGAPKPAFYDGLLHQSIVPDTVPETVDGWRNVNADGTSILPAECFVACNQFFVPSDNAFDFESRWKDRTSKLKECDGFISFDLLRRDVQAKGHGIVPMGEEEPSYMTCTIWKDRAAFDGWRTGTAFKEAHGAASNGSGEDKEKQQPQKPPGPPLWSKPPVAVFYEGTLVISSLEGA